MIRNSLIVVSIVALLIGGTIGYLFGFRAGGNAVSVEMNEKIREVQSALDMFVPPYPDIVNVIGGRITAIDGTSLTIEIPSFTDRYPKPDTPMATETRTVAITGETKTVSINFDQKTFKNGSPQQKEISSNDLEVDDVVSVTVKENARAEQNLTAVSINRSSGI